MYLKSWWSRTYNRPLKDPLLQDYTPEELYYEYCDHTERVKAAEDRAEEEGDRIEEDNFKAAQDWAEQEEQKELEEMRKRQAEETEKKKQQEWMEEQIKHNKEKLGEDFGEDVSLDFSEI